MDPHPSHDRRTRSPAATSSAAAGGLGAGRAGVAAGRRAARGDRRRLPGLPHFPPKAKRVIYLFQSGGAVAARPVRLQAEARRSCAARSCPTRSAWASGSPA